MSLPLRTLLVVCALVIAPACRLVEPGRKGYSPLVPLATSADAVTLEIFSAPLAIDDPRLAALWGEVDEQPFAPELRHGLHQNGIRVGVIGPHVPDSLAGMLKVTDERVAERSLVPLETEPGVVLRMLQPRMGSRNDLVVREARDRVSVLRPTEGLVEGKTYQRAECQLALRVFWETESRVRLEFVPELHHGEMKAEAVGSEGVFMWKPQRTKQVYHDLKISATLRPGQMFVITSAADKPGTIGHAFFADQGEEKPVQKLWVIRMAGAGPDRAFVDEGPQQATDELTSDLAD